MLKTVLFVAAVTSAASAADVPAPPTDLLVGSVRDQTGEAMVGAGVTTVDAAGRAIGADHTDAQGTFAIQPAGNPVAVEVRCRYCATARVGLHGQSTVVVFVRRYTALESRAPTPEDLAALPYGRIVDDLALIPYTVPSQDGTDISDRGLDRGYGLVADDGAPIVDFATGESALVDFPDRYVRSVDVTPPVGAFRYGSDAGGGRFALDQLDGNASAASFDGGIASALALEPTFGDVHPSYGVSSDGGTLARRADVDLTTPFDGGFLRAGIDSGSEAVTGYVEARNVDSVRISYATASQNYRTFAGFSASEAGVENVASGASEYRSSYLDADFRVEHPGTVTFAFGAAATQETAYYVLATPTLYELVGRAGEETLYAEASAGDERTGATAGLGFTSVNAAENLQNGNPSGQSSFLVPSLAAHAAIGGGGAYVRAAFSESSRVPSLVEAAGTTEQTAFPLQRGELAESALGYDAGGRLRAEAIAYQEFLHGFGEQRLDGLGASLAWQVTPLVSLRAWSLRDAPLDYVTPSATNGNDLSRQIAWASYANGAGGLRVDAIAHRDVGTDGPAIGLDGDVLLPLVPHLAIDVGTQQRDAGMQQREVGAQERNVRMYFIGLRAR